LRTSIPTNSIDETFAFQKLQSRNAKTHQKSILSDKSYEDIEREATDTKSHHVRRGDWSIVSKSIDNYARKTTITSAKKEAQRFNKKA
jgi:hypothetical protein